MAEEKKMEGLDVADACSVNFMRTCKVDHADLCVLDKQ
jgi:hypothetical protein